MAKLTVIRGQQSGEYEIGEKLTIGRAPGSDIVIEDVGASRVQAEIVKSDNGYVIRDLGSQNGTFVDDKLLDGKEAREAALMDRSKIRVAGWTALFVDESAAPESLADTKELTASWIEDEERLSASASAVEKTVATERQARARAALQITDQRALHDTLKLLDDIGRLIHSLRDADNLLNEIARQCLFAFDACDSCFILFKGPDAAKPTIRAALQRTEEGVDCVGASDAAVRLSRTIISRALENRESIYRSNVPQDEDFGAVKSIADLEIQSFLCAPLIRGGEAFGVIYMDSRRPKAELAESDLQLLSIIANEAALAIENAELHQELRLAKECLEKENRELRQKMSDEFDFGGGIIGVSPAMLDAIERAKKAARVDTSVFITGESGVGKELFAKAIHYNSSRGAAPFVSFNCARGDSLIETELFGIEAWRASGVKPHPGLFERANGGTVFLDEIGAMSLDVQAKILRCLQERKVRRVGGAREIEVDVRVIAATNKDLEGAIEAGEFRNDLYHRFATVTIRVPPLRERADDILRLADHFLKKYCFKFGKSIEGFSAAAQEALVSYSWEKNNVRELESRVEEMVAMADDGALIDKKDLPPEIAKSSHVRIPEPPDPVGSMKRSVAEYEKRIIAAKLHETEGKIQRAARELAVSAMGLRLKIEKYGMWDVVEAARKKKHSSETPSGSS